MPGATASKKKRGKAPKKNKTSMKKASIGDRGSSDSCYDDDDLPEESEEEQESPQDYRKGGYHPVNIGDVFNDSYRVIRKLGWGHFSTVWLCWSSKSRRYVALKIVKSASHYTEAAKDEIELLEQVHIRNPTDPGYGYVVQLLDNFKVTGANGANYKGLPIPMVKRITKQVLLGLHYMHTECKIIHTDIKPENILVCVNDDYIQMLVDDVEKASASGKLTSSQVSNLPNDHSSASTGKMSKNKKKKLKKKLKKAAETASQEVSAREEKPSEDNTSDVSDAGVNDTSEGGDNAELAEEKWKNKKSWDDFDPFTIPINVKIADLGNACWTYHHFTDGIQTRQYRSLEVLLGSGYDTPADIWSVACMVFELVTGDYLFEPHSGEGYGRDDDHIAQMIELLGRVPKHVALGGKYSKEYFNKKGGLKYIQKLKPWSLVDVLREKYNWTEKDAEDMSSFIVPMLDYVPENRVTAEDCLKHRWLEDTQHNGDEVYLAK
ncbi:Serine/threonine-protein kinase spk-1 [Trichoplax sp. H2]|nr:Serine/threonine-protein kinase spk-1 [Trichoplax sp. H2]|eukprot:RDD43847.1 Serine/threonine-protein kinase spk-1 [Trichoplax sp. H2]